MKAHSDDVKYDLDWWASADLEDMPEDAVPTVMRILAADQLHSPSSYVPSGDKHARAWVNMRRHAVRTRRADTEAQARKWLAIAAALIPLAGIASPALWLAVRSWT